MTTMTEVVPYIEGDVAETHPRRLLRELSQSEFVEKYASGSLRKSMRLGFDVRDAYLRERVKLEFGYGFDVIQKSWVMFNDPKFQSSQAITELCWHLERMIELRPFESDVFVAKEMDIEKPDGSKKRGLGIFVMKTSAAWLPKGYIVYALVTERQANGTLSPAINPF